MIIKKYNLIFKKRIFILAIIVSFIFFTFGLIGRINYSSNLDTSTRATTLPTVATGFSQNNFNIFPNDQLEFNVFLNIPANNYISAAKISLLYPSENLDFVSSTLANTACINQGYKFTDQIEETALNGKVKQTKIIKAGNASLASNMICFGTFKFKPKASLILPLNTEINFDLTDYQIVGPVGSYPISLEAGADKISISISNSVTSTISPTPTIDLKSYRKSKGDLDNDGIIGILDLSLLSTDWQTTNTRSDINSDGKVDILDLSILAANWGINV